MVARTNKRRKSIHADIPINSHTSYYCTDHKNTHKSSSTPGITKSGTMHNINPEKENHLIEAIIFTADFLSGIDEKSSSKKSPWICGSGFTETSEFEFDNDPGTNYNEGGFGMKRKQLISYQNTDDLTRKVNALFHRNRNTLSLDEALEIRDDPMVKDDCEEYHNDYCSVHNLQRKTDDGTSTCPSTNPSLSQADLNHWYSSSWSSFTYHGSARESSCAPLLLGSNSNYLQKPLPLAPSQRDSARWQTRNQRNSTLGDGSGPLLPDFLRGVEFKNTGNGNTYREQIPVIALPPSPPTSFSSPSEYERRHAAIAIPQAGAAVQNETEIEVEIETEAFRPRAVDNSRAAVGTEKGRPYSLCRFGQKTKGCWENTKRFFRRGKEKI